ncbi:MAG: preprotein translocase subunit SecG [bacterium]
MGIVLTIIHVIICFALILIVLLQAGKGASLGSAFGGGGASQTAFGTMRGNILGRITTVAAILFMVTSILLTVIYAHEGSIIKGRRGVEQVAPVKEETALPAEKETAAPTPEGVVPGGEATPKGTVKPGGVTPEAAVKIEEKTAPAAIPSPASEGGQPAPPVSKGKEEAAPKVEPTPPKVEEKQ